MTTAGMIDADFSLPRRVIRKLLRGRWERRARNVLVVGNHCGHLVRFLNRRGINAAGMDDDTTANDWDDAKVHFGSIAGVFPYPPHQADLVLIGECRTFQRGLVGPEPLIAMANLLSSLRSKGRLIWLRSTGPVGGPVHLTAGLESDLSQFPGDVSIHAYEDGWERYLSLEWLLGRRREIDLELITLRVPAEPISRLNWHQLAREVALDRSQVTRSERAA